MDGWHKWGHISWWTLECVSSNNEAWEEWVLWDHWVFFFILCILCCLILSFKTFCIKPFFNCKSWRRIRRLKWCLYIFMFSQLILQMCVGRAGDSCLLLWKEMKIWDYFCFWFGWGFFWPPLYCANWNVIQNGAGLSLESDTALARAYSHL